MERKLFFILIVGMLILTGCGPKPPKTLVAYIQEGYSNPIKVLAAEDGVPVYQFMSQVNTTPYYGWCVAYEVEVPLDDGSSEKWQFERVFLYQDLKYFEVIGYNSGLGVFIPGINEKEGKWCNY